MSNNSKFAIGIVTLCLFVLVLFADVMPITLLTIFIVCAPLIVIWMAAFVMTEPSVKVRDLKEGEDWGYDDRPDIKPME
jgi:ABC-type polysaccharide/polyol phosphate export permease